MGNGQPRTDNLLSGLWRGTNAFVSATLPIVLHSRVARLFRAANHTDYKKDKTHKIIKENAVWILKRDYKRPCPFGRG